MSKIYGEVCGDNRFEIIESAKQKLIECTNISTSPDEMKVIDNILYRMWQMDFLPPVSGANVAEIPPTGIGDLSDGYHTFNELYHHRAVLFSVICNSLRGIAWKSKQHADGTMYDGMFIVGVNTPDGQATYHYNLEPYWNLFQVTELNRAPVWDGHTSAQAIERIGKLVANIVPVGCGRWLKDRDTLKCSECGFGYFPSSVTFQDGQCVGGHIYKHCPVCGVKMYKKDGEPE